MIDIKKISYAFLPYPPQSNYNDLLKEWLNKHPWVTISKGVKFPLETKVLGTPLEIKDGTVINGPMVIKGSGNVAIGKYGGIAENLYIISSNHIMNQADVAGPFANNLDISKGPVYIGNNVWIGDNVTILSGVTIGDGAVIGAGSIVTKDIPAFGVAVGVPARLIRVRFSNEMIRELIFLSWWHWEYQTIIKNLDFFSHELDEIKLKELITKLDLSDEKEITNINLIDSKSNNYLLDGWGAKEGEFRWVQKDQAGLIFKIDDLSKYNYFSFLCHSYFKPQTVSLFINGVNNGKIEVQTVEKQYHIKIKGLKKGVNTIRLYFQRGFSPALVQNNNFDRRILYCRFLKFSLE